MNDIIRFYKKDLIILLYWRITNRATPQSSGFVGVINFERKKYKFFYLIFGFVKCLLIYGATSRRGLKSRVSQLNGFFKSCKKVRWSVP